MAPQAAQKNITVETLREVVIPLPPLEEQRRIVADLKTEAAQIEAAREPHSQLRGKDSARH